LFRRLTGGEPFASLLSATQSEMPGRYQPMRQNRKGFVAETANPSSHPDFRLMLIMSLTAAPSVAHDRVVTTNGASPRQTIQRNYP